LAIVGIAECLGPVKVFGNESAVRLFRGLAMQPILHLVVDQLFNLSLLAQYVVVVVCFQIRCAATFGIVFGSFSHYGKIAADEI
jgi:hypothetical protein